MYKIEIKNLGSDKASLCENIKYLGYKDLYDLVKPYIIEEHLSFGLPNNCPNGKEWGNIYCGKKIIGQIKMTFIEE